MATGWRLEKRLYHSRPSVYEGGSAPYTWIPMESFPIFATRREAVRAFLENIDKDLIGAPDKFLQMHWQTPFYRNMVRVSKVMV